MSKQAQVPPEVETLATEAFLRHADSCPWPALNAALSAAYEHFSERLLSKEVIEAAAEGAYTEMAARCKGSVPWERLWESSKEQWIGHATVSLGTAVRAISTPGETESRKYVISYCGGPLDGIGGFAKDLDQLELGEGTYSLLEWDDDGDVVFEWKEATDGAA